MPKKMLHNELLKLNADGWPDRLVPRRASDNRARLNTEDILKMIEGADERGLISQLPRFVAADLTRVPTLNPEDLELSVMAKKLKRIEQQLQVHDQLLCPAPRQQQPQQTSTANALNTVAAESVRDEDTTSWANLASMKDTDDGYTVVSYQRRQRPSASVDNPRGPNDGGSTSHRARRLIGTKANNDTSDRPAVVAVQRRLMAFVGRLHKDTTEDQLQSWLVTAGLQEVKCKKLTPKNGKEFNTAAFFVSSAAASKDLFYDEQTWPAGCELRDWYIKTNHSSQ